MLSFFVVGGGEASSFDRSVLASFRYSGFPCESGVTCRNMYACVNMYMCRLYMHIRNMYECVNMYMRVGGQGSVGWGVG